MVQWVTKREIWCFDLTWANYKSNPASKSNLIPVTSIPLINIQRTNIQLTISGRRHQKESSWRHREVPSGPMVARSKARPYSSEVPSVFADTETWSQLRMPAAISISTSFFTKIGVGDFSKLVPKINLALCRINFIESITAAIRQVSRMTLGPTMNGVSHG
jgi:hypothetical protein